MSDISSNQSLNKILNQLGINSSKDKFAPKEMKDQLGQEDFLKLEFIKNGNFVPATIQRVLISFILTLLVY